MRLSQLSLCSLAALLVLGCQSGRGPATLPTDTVAGTADAVYQPSATLLSNTDRPAYEGTLGRWTLDVAGNFASLTPARSLEATPGIGTYDVNITDALTRTFCRDCVRIQSIELDGDNNPVVTVGMRHPFELGDPGLPITAQNRRDLFLFNVKGIIFSNNDPATIGSLTLPTHVLVQPDGYAAKSGHHDRDSVPALDANPYMIFSPGGTPTSTGNFDAATGQFTDMSNPTGFNVIGQGQEATAAFTFDVGNGGSISVDLVLTAGYGQSVANKAQRMSPEYYPAEFGGGPWRVEIDDFGTFGTAPGSPQTTEVRVYDFAMAHGVFDAAFPGTDHLGVSWDPDLSVELSIPEFRATPFLPSGAPTGTGAIDDPLVYSITADNQLGIANGSYTGLLSVMSNRPVDTANPGEADDVSGIGPDLDATNLFAIDAIVTYQPVDIVVQTVVGIPPVADLASSKPTVMVGNGAYFYPGPGTMDSDGTIDQWVYDTDWDGNPGSFNADIVMTTPDPVAIRFNTVGSTTVGLRVRDDDSNYGYDTLAITVNPVGAPFTSPAMSFPSEAGELFQTSDHVPVAVDANFPGNVYILQDPNATSTTDYAIYRSTDFGRTFDAGTPIYATLRTHAGDNFTWISGRGITVLADGSVGLVCNTTATSGVDGRGIYYVWIDADPHGTGVDAGGGTHDMIRLNVNTSLQSWGDPSIWADANDPTKAYFTYKYTPTSLPDTANFAAVTAANTANPVRLYEDEFVTAADNLTIENIRSYLDPANNALHVAWEERQTGVDTWIAYSRVELNNPVGPRARLSITSTFGANVSVNSPSPAITTNGDAVVSFNADFDITTGTDYDMAVAKIQNNAGALSWITPVSRVTIADGQGKGFLVGDRTTGRLTLAFTHGGSGTSAISGMTDVRTVLLDSNLNVIGGPQSLQTFDPAPGPIMTTRHDDPFGAIDPNTGEAFFMWHEEGPPEATGYRWSE